MCDTRQNSPDLIEQTFFKVLAAVNVKAQRDVVTVGHGVDSDEPGHQRSCHVLKVNIHFLIDA